MISLKKKSAPEFLPNNRVKLIRAGKDYFDLLLQLINSAIESIHLQTYIFESDETGWMVANALIAAAKRNVAVYLIADGYASQHISNNLLKELKEAGVHFRFFEPLFKSKHFYFGRRMHHKILLTDSRFSLVGGINISNHYNDMPNHRAWLDFSLFAEGEIAKPLCVLCWKTWNNFPFHMEAPDCENKKIDFRFSENESMRVRMRRNDWVRRKNEISATYVQMLLNVTSDITILCSYFLPGATIRRLLKEAAKRGVQIRLITAGPSDVMLAKHAERWLYDMLLRNNIKIFEYQPSILHAKIAVCDSKWMTIGSYNINDISAHASIELNLDVQNEAFAIQTENNLEAIIQNDCIPITMEQHRTAKNIYNQLLRWISYHSIRVIFHFVTFYYKRTSYPKKSAD